MDKLKQAIADLHFCSEVIDRERFAGTDQNPKGVRDLLYSALKTVEHEVAEVLADAARIDGLRKLAGCVENGTDTTVHLFQDDATKDWMVRVGKQWPEHGGSLREAIDAAIAKDNE